MKEKAKSKINKAPILAALILFTSYGFVSNAVSVPLGADIITVVDESGSMSAEHAFLVGGVMATLDSALSTAGVTSNNFGLVGFGTRSHGTSQLGHQHDVGGAGSQYGTSGEFATSAGGLVSTGSLEDGYQAMDVALGYTERVGDFARQMILVTDEDRDVASGFGGLTFAVMEARLAAQDFILNAIINATFSSSGGGAGAILGLKADGSVYRADGFGGFTLSAAGVGGLSSAEGSTTVDYINLAHNLGGAAWDLNQLRAGGLIADSFALAFVDGKVQEIITNRVPAPHTIALLGLGLFAIGAIRRHKKAA